ncbi:MAG: hypothetical protein MR487_00185 [Lachnospiraceae bacterium]|nr:hypothetical protein [Lachnospiraceae bacterium]
MKSKMNDMIKDCIARGICNDNFVGTIDGNNIDLNFCKEKREEFIKNNSIDDIVDDGSENIIVILESPHISEYEHADEGFIAPAIGKTGDYLQKYFYKCIKRILLPNIRYNVILMNAIQYQCSLGFETKKFRDKNWCDLWFNYNKSNDFINRLTSYNPNIIINACTIGGHIERESDATIKKPGLKYIKNIIHDQEKYQKTKEKLKELNMKEKYTLKGYVEAEIINVQNVQILHSSHPSSWFNTKNIKFV